MSDNGHKKKAISAKSHEDMVAEWMLDPEFKAEYDALEDEYNLFREMLQARKIAGLTQDDVAMLMGTKAPAVARLEALGNDEKYSPRISTLRKYAQAVGCKLEIHLRPLNKRQIFRKQRA